MIDFLVPPKKWDFELIQDGLGLNRLGKRDNKNLAIVPKPIRSCTFNKCQYLWQTYLDQVFDIDASLRRTSFEVP